ncbi:XRE family transcriptional regulator [Flavobacterium sp.]|uniref:XRE family transcriptional regulator n=1 Tax=Flavobacterium sp. TaxID=239 RepID=UPI0040347DBE
MSLFSDNIRYLRVKNGYSQEKVAKDLAIQRERYRKYDDGTSEPPYELLKRISSYYGVTVDILLSVDIRKLKEDTLIKLDNNRLLFPIMVDRNGDNLVEIVTHKAKAGYLTGYSDPEFVGSLPQFHFPFLGTGKHRVFPVEGDSMPPHEDGSFIVTRYIEQLGEVVDGKTYILITRDDGMVYKRLNRNGKNELTLESDNELYPPYKVRISDILEIWEYQYHLGKNDKRLSRTPRGIEEMFHELKKEIRQLSLKG